MGREGKREFLKHPRVPLEPGKATAGELLERMSRTGFQGRKLGEALGVWKQMLVEKRNVVIMALSGAMVPAGMGRLVSFLLRKRAIDVLVCTGATLSHDLYEALGARHFLGTHMVDDAALLRHRIDRMYDVYADEDQFEVADKWVMSWAARTLKDDHPYTSREIVAGVGRALAKVPGAKRSVLRSAYEAGVPVFVPALADSSLGFSIMTGNRRNRRRIVVDMMRDCDEISRLVEVAPQTSVVIVGGGVPKNYVQQTAVIAGYEVGREQMHRLAVQITTDSPQWGGLSGCTLEESVSWGKYHPDAEMVTCYADATIALPFLVSALAEWKGLAQRVPPQFEWDRDPVRIRFRRPHA